MGYYTLFAIDAPEHVKEYIRETYCEFDNGETYKWYSYKDDLIETSTKYPLSLITVTGHGEEREDIWREYYINGTRQRAETTITFTPCTLALPKKEIRTVNVTVLGVDVPVEIECLVSTTDDEVYEQAKELVKRML